MDQNRARNYFFGHFLKLGLSVFLQVPYIDSLQQCITSSRGKTYEKSFQGPHIGQKGPKSGPNLFFLLFSQVWFISFP